MNDVSDGTMCESRGSRKASISVERRKELMALAGEATDWIMGRNIKPHELCLFRTMVEMLTDVRN